MSKASVPAERLEALAASAEKAGMSIYGLEWDGVKLAKELREIVAMLAEAREEGEPRTVLVVGNEGSDRVAKALQSPASAGTEGLRAERAEADIEKLKMDAEHLQYERDEARSELERERRWRLADSKLPRSEEAAEPEPDLEPERDMHWKKRAYDTLAQFGVPFERARSIANGIRVLAARYEKEIASLRASLEGKHCLCTFDKEGTHLNDCPLHGSIDRSAPVVHSATCPRCFLSFTCTGGCNE